MFWQIRPSWRGNNYVVAHWGAYLTTLGIEVQTAMFKEIKTLLTAFHETLKGSILRLEEETLKN